MFTLRSPLLLPHWSVTHQTQSGRLRDGKILQEHITPHKRAIQGEDQLLFVQCVDVHCPDIAERFQPLSTPLFEEPSHHNGSHCKLLRASIVWNPISLSASPSARHELKVMPTLWLRNIKMDYSNIHIDHHSKSDANPAAALQPQDKLIPSYTYNFIWIVDAA